MRTILPLVAAIALTWASTGAVAAPEVLPASSHVKAAVTPAGKVKSKFVDGNDGTPPLLGWGSCADILGKPSGGGFSVNIGTYCGLIEPSPGAATLTTTTLGTGWTMGGTGNRVLTLGTGVSNTVVTFTATFSGRVAIKQLRVESISSGSSDLIGPTQVIGCSATQITTGIRIRCRPSMDPRTTGQNPSGMKDYQVRRDGNSTPIGSTNAATVGLSAQFQGIELGGSTGGSLSQSGADYLLVTNGDGIGSTENGYYIYTGTTSTFRLCGKLQSITGGNSNAAAYFMARESVSDAGARFTTIRGNTTGVRARGRTTANASSLSYGANVTQAPPHWECIARTPSNWITELSTDGNAFNVVDNTMPIVLADSLPVGVLGGHGGAAASTIDIRQLSLTRDADIVYDDPITDGQPHAYTMTGRDNANNSGAASASVSATAPTGGDAIAPATPTGLVDVSSTSTEVCWTSNECTDPSGIRGYRGAISTTLGGTYTDQPEQVSRTFCQTGVAASTTRYAKTSCYDNAGNRSALTLAGVAGTSLASPGGDVVAPSTPTNFTAIPLNATTVRFRWSASTDNVGGCGVAAYRLYRIGQNGPALAATFTGLQGDYVPGGVAGTPAQYRLSSIDCASPFNESAMTDPPLSAATSPSSGGTLLLNDDFSSGVLDVRTAQNPNGNWGTSRDAGTTQQVQNTIVFNSPYALMERTTPVDRASHSEVIIRKPGNFELGKVYFIGLAKYLKDWTASGMIPPAHAAGTASGATWDIIFQCHGTNQNHTPGTTISNPMCTLDARRGQYTFQVLGDYDDGLAPYARKPKITLPISSTADSNRWAAWVFEFRFGGGMVGGAWRGIPQEGYWKIWHDDVLVFEDRGLNYFTTDNLPPFIKIGLYKGQHTTDDAGIPNRTVYDDAIKIGKQEDGVGYDDVRPRQ